MRKLLWHSNAPHTPTGYGVQSGLTLPLLAKHYDVACSAFYGLEGAPIRWEGIPMFPGLGADFGNSTLPQHADRFFGDPRNGLVLTLCDVWPLDPEMASELNMACWCPVDHNPVPPKVAEFFVRSGAIPIAMTRFGEAQLGLFDPLYVPHSVDTQVYRPLDKSKSRAGLIPDDAFLVGMVAANKGRPSRKCFAQSIRAFAEFSQGKDNVYLYLHTVMDPQFGGGEDLGSLLGAFGIPDNRVRIADQYSMIYNPYSGQNMARILSSLDVLLNPSMGEGFGVPIIEAQACGVPAIVTDWTSMPEVLGAGWKVGFEPAWTLQNSWQATPHISEIVDALEECYSLKPAARHKLASTARAHAKQYDIQRVFREHWLPTLKVVEQRFDLRSPVTIPSRLEAVAA